MDQSHLEDAGIFPIIKVNLLSRDLLCIFFPEV